MNSVKIKSVDAPKHDVERAAQLWALTNFIAEAAIIPDRLITADFFERVAFTEQGHQALKQLRNSYPAEDENFYILWYLQSFGGIIC